MPKTPLAPLGALLDRRRSTGRAPHAADAASGGPDRRDDNPAATTPPIQPARPKEIGGPAGPEPTRFGDWEQKGRATDF